MLRHVLQRKAMRVTALAQPSAKAAPTRPAAKEPTLTTSRKSVTKATDPSKRRSAVSKKKEKAATPRAPSAYNLFVREKMPALRKSEGKQLAQLMGEIADMWKQLSDEAKQPFQTQSQELKAVVDVKRNEEKAEKQKNARPLQPFAAFTSQHYPEFHAKHPELKFPDIMKKVGGAYRSLPSEEKEAITADYKAKMAVWKANHQAAGAAEDDGVADVSL